MEMLVLINIILSIFMPLQSTLMQTETGWVKTPNGTYYLKESKPVKGVQVIDKDTYYFDQNGIMQTGVQNTPEEKYFDESGKLTEGIQNIDNKLMLYTKEGLAETGWYEIDNNKYYVIKGVIQTGEQTIKDKEYLFDENGVLQTGWHNDKYYGPNGDLQSGEVEIDGKKYYLQTNGTLYKGLMNDTYYNEDGSIFIGNMWIEDLYISTDDNGKITYKATKKGMEVADRSKTISSESLQDYIKEVYEPYTEDLKSGTYSAEPMPGDLVVFKDKEDYRILAGVYTGYGKMQTNEGEKGIDSEDELFVGYLRLNFLS